MQENYEVAIFRFFIFRVYQMNTESILLLAVCFLSLAPVSDVKHKVFITGVEFRGQRTSSLA